MKIEWVSRFSIHDTKDEENRLSMDIPVVRLAEVDAVIGRMVELVKEINAKSVIPCSIAPELSTTSCFDINKITQKILASPLVAAWRERQKKEEGKS